MEGSSLSKDARNLARSFVVLVAVVWYGAVVWLAIAYLRRELLPLLTAWPGGPAAWLDLARALVGLAVLTATAVVGHLGAKMVVAAFQVSGGDVVRSSPSSFPSPVTVAVGAWVLAFTLLALVALVAALRFYDGSDLHAAVLTTLAAAVGASIATILGYLKHASEDKDFDPAYGAWYVGRPVIGLLLGLLFYFVIAGGLVVVLPSAADRALNQYGLVAVGGLVGLFSKNAVEKLREVFAVLFRTGDQSRAELLDRLPTKLRGQVEPYLPAGGSTRARRGGS